MYLHSLTCGFYWPRRGYDDTTLRRLDGGEKVKGCLEGVKLRNGDQESVRIPSEEVINGKRSGIYWIPL